MYYTEHKPKNKNRGGLGTRVRFPATANLFTSSIGGQPKNTFHAHILCSEQEATFFQHLDSHCKKRPQDCYFGPVQLASKGLPSTSAFIVSMYICPCPYTLNSIFMV